MILLEEQPTSPPWRINCLNTCQDMFTYTKNEIPQDTLRNIFNHHARSHTNSYQIFTDGSKTEEGVGYAYTCMDHSHQCRISRIATIFTAELFAIRDAVNYAESNLQNLQTITIHSDSKSAIQAISSPHPKNPIIHQIQTLIINSHKSYSMCWVPSHIGIRGNEEADRLAGECIRTLQIAPHSLPRSDHKCSIKQRIKRAWHSSWQSNTLNKLRDSLPNVAKKYKDNLPRSWSTKLTRLRIGHTRLTHEYLIKKEPQPFCMECLVPLTIKHILIECPSFAQHRGIFGFPGPPTLSEVFKPENAGLNGPLHNFLKTINVFNKL